MRSIPIDLQTHIAGEVTSLTRCLKITKSNGAIVRITTHDRDLVVGGERYFSGVPFTMSALQSTDTLAVDNAEVKLGFDDLNIIVRTDFEDGLYDQAPFEVFIVNWEDTSDGVIYLKRGKLGDITFEDDTHVKIAIRGLTQDLQRSVVEKYSPTCRVNLGGKKCGVVNSPIRIRRPRQKVKTFDWFLVPTTGVTDVSYTNPAFETDSAVANTDVADAITGWLMGTNSFWAVADDISPFEGDYYLAGGADGGAAGDGAEMTLYREFTTTDLGLNNTNVDDGDYTVDFTILIAALDENLNNPGRVFIEQIDTLGRTIKFEATDYIYPDVEDWQGIGITGFVLPGCRTIKFGIQARKLEGTSASVAFDATQIRFWSHEAATFSSKVFRTMRLPFYASDEAYPLGNVSFEANGSVVNANNPIIQGWITGVGNWWQVVGSVGAMDPVTGDWMLRGGDNGTATNDQVYTITQTATMPVANGDNVNLAAGWYTFVVDVWAAKLDAGSDPRMTVEFLDVSQSVLDTFDTGYNTAGPVDTWTLMELIGTIPTNAISMRITLYARSGTGSAANVLFDDAVGFELVTAYEHQLDPEYAHLNDVEPNHDFATGAYSVDGDAIVQARDPVFFFGTVTDTVDERTFEATGITGTAAQYYSGKITWLNGNNAGKTSFIRIWDNGSKLLKMYDTLRGEIQIGDKFVYAMGCDKLIATCADRFGNAHNFRGEPYLPGPTKVVEFMTAT